MFGLCVLNVVFEAPALSETASFQPLLILKVGTPAVEETNYL